MMEGDAAKRRLSRFWRPVLVAYSRDLPATRRRRRIRPGTDNPAGSPVSSPP